MDPRKKEDILLELLTGETSDSTPELDDLTQFLTQPPKPAPQKTRRRQGSRPEVGKKRRATHYLSQATFQRMETLLPEIRRILPVDAQKRLSRSSLVDSAMQMLLQDFAQKGERSLLVRWFLSGPRDMA
ncbi:MAG TPA: hypothetical protein ENN98_01865 [Desulfurivibrio alkaliphilus]|uniref:Uncharacterized protein n=1 Tax=Desulfurivibrio alkaliphilus TaxID=427923 RepID=A0A7C2TK30_9BACT|nr:hypothetical protein [Desulfurivibrio alkaliphilus]